MPAVVTSGARIIMLDSLLTSNAAWAAWGLLGAVVAFGAIAALGNCYIRFLQKRYMGQYIREDGPQSHHSKAGTPTLGGLLILLGAALGTLVVSLLNPGQMLTMPVWITLLSGLIFGALGFSDDYLKIAKKHNKGITGYTKLAIQAGFGAVIGLYLLTYQDRSSVNVFYKTALELGLFYPLFSAFTVAATSNAVNITDGLDGLASWTTLITFIATSVILATTGYPELSIIALTLAGACAGFLLFNRHPARIFMGDTGSLALGGLFGTMMVLGDAELWTPLVGVIYVAECLSVILQVISFKTTGKRIFKMAPLHHHFELTGMHETQVVVMFSLAQFSGCLLGLYINQL